MAKNLVLAMSALSLVTVPGMANAHRHVGYDNENGYSRGDDQNDDQGDEGQQGYYPQQVYSNSNAYYGRRYGYNRHRCSGTTGTIVGAGAGALIGRSIGRGSGYYRQNSGTTGTIVGGVLGALIGRQVGKSTC